LSDYVCCYGGSMPAQPQRNAMNERKQTPTPAATATKGIGHARSDLELLRWRAEVLMDEMMLGGVDFAANGPTSVSAPSAIHAVSGPEKPDRELVRSDPDVEYVSADRYQNGAYATPTPVAKSHVATNAEQSAEQRDGRHEQTARPSTVTPASTLSAQPHYDAQPWVASAEERYRQLARPQPPATQPPILAEGPGGENGPGAEAIWQGSDSLHPPGTNGHGVFYQESDLPTTTSTGVRRAAPQFAGSPISNLGGKGVNGRRSNLLPRLSTADVEALQHEIYTLQNEIDHVLPAGHDSNKRVRHLLERAQAILQQDAMRSAEVEYYLQQVRTIFQRVQQTVDWSGIYRNRLFIYLIAWALLSSIVLVACYLYQDLIENFVVAIGALAMDSLILQHLLAVVATFFAGTFGGALGTLANLHHHSRLPYGFIDRKFGLRGLILPLLGGIVGLLCYVPIGLLFYLLRLNPSQNILLSIFPVLLAFVYGVSQESIYGTRE
jgi:hypothetical protein